MVSDVPTGQFRSAMFPQGSSGQRCSHRAAKVSEVLRGQLKSVMFLVNEHHRSRNIIRQLPSMMATASAPSQIAQPSNLFFFSETS